ncbi:nitrile hydratase accessory protein [Methylopila sp. M107]|uniref:nitrile hydratase accessory protein n=1 Tax=Methylopila sp. M107 TaxID=1101190 RepID=UPI000365293E|nr:nitrile hydratase accessory protein [Methylopila sp. M107]
MRPPEAPERPFEEPWQAQVFALAVALSEAGVFGWGTWTETLSARIASHPDEAYWLSWLAALEEVSGAAGLVSQGDLAARRDAWDRAAKATPHGRPIALGAG